MFSLTFNFNNFLKPGESMPQNGMRQRGGFGGGGGGGFGVAALVEAETAVAAVTALINMA